MFTQDLEAIDELRKNAINAFEPHSSGIRKLQAYAAQLVWMGSKFPIDLGADFTWYSSLGYHTETAVSQNNIRFELANILFNLAVLYCQLAVSANRSTTEGLKLASNYFCHSAGVISHLKTSVIPDMRSTVPDDMDTMTLECVEQLLLAQAQECFWHKAVKDGLKDASIAKLAAKVSDLYTLGTDYAVKSESISSEWIHHMAAKQHHFAAAAQYRAACDCLEKRRYGEEVARLQESLAQANEALKEARYISKVVLGDLNGLKNKVQDDLKRAEKDNDMIYLNPVPPKSELKALDRASMVSAKVTKEIADPVALLGDQGELGRPFFTKLVPYSVHIAGTIYTSRRDQTINTIVDDLKNLTAQIHSLLQSLNLPGSLQALEKPLGLPPGLVSHAEEIRQQRGMDRLQRMSDDVDKLRKNDRLAYEEGVNFLRTEAEDEEKAQRKYGTDRWARPSSEVVAKALYRQMTEVDGYLKQADTSDGTVREKMKQNEPLISLLNGVDRDLEEVVPSSKRVVMTGALEREVSKLRSALNDISRLESKRHRKIESLKTKAHADDISPDLHKEASRLEREHPMQKIEAVQFEDFFDERLRRYTADQDTVTTEQLEQSDLLSRLTSANTSFTHARRGDSSTKDREQALQQLENAYFAYKEIVQNLEVGRKFYNDLAGIVGKFRDECRAFAFQRRAEAEQLEVEILHALPMAGLSLQQKEQQQQPPPAAQPQSHHHQQQPQQQQQRQPRPTRSSYATRTSNIDGDDQPLAAPVALKPPTQTVATNDHASYMPAPQAPAPGMWTPEVGIKFGNPAPGLQMGQVGGEGGKGRGRNGGGEWDPSRGVKFG